MKNLVIFAVCLMVFLPEWSLAGGKCKMSDDLSLDGLSRHENGDLQGAVGLYEKTLKACPENCLTWNWLATVQLDMGDNRKAIESAKQAIKCYRDPEINNVAEALVIIGTAKGRLQDINGAFSAFKKACELDPLNLEALSNLGMAYIHKHDLKSAREALEKTVRMDEDYAYGWYGLAFVAYNMGNIDAALFAAKRASDLEPYNQEYLQVYMKIKNG